MNDPSPRHVLDRLVALMNAAGPVELLPSEASLVGLVDEARALAAELKDPVSIFTATLAQAFLVTRREVDSGGDLSAGLEVVESIQRCLRAAVLGPQH